MPAQRKAALPSQARNASSNAKGGSDNKSIYYFRFGSTSTATKRREPEMGVLTTRLAAKPVAATGLADKGAWLRRCDVKSRRDVNHGGTRCRLGVVLVGVVLVLSTFRDYGVTWDEDVTNWYGNFVLDYYLSFFGDKTALHWRDLYTTAPCST